MRHETLDELDKEGIEVRLSNDQAARLAESQLVEVRPRGGTTYQLLPNDRVGAVRFGDLQVEVTPKHKIGVANLMFLLGYAKDPGFRLDSVTAEGHGELWPAMAHSLIAAVEGALTAGVLQGYRTEEEALLTVRGRIAFETQLRRRPGMAVPIEVRFDDFTPNIAENQILLAALHVMLRVPGLGTSTRRRLVHLVSRFAGVTRLPPGSRAPDWQPTRLNQRYQSALGLADILLRHSSTRSRRGGAEMSAFVVVMWRVFEDFVTTALTRALAEYPGVMREQLPAFLTGDGDWRSGRGGQSAVGAHGDVTMAVDLVHLDPAHAPTVVFDAKYKLASLSGANANADHYQMLAYCTALEAPAAWLIYAGGGRDIRRRIKNTEVEVVAAPLNLALPPDQVLARIQEIGEGALGRRSWAGSRTVGRP